jgi:hypothetical protein
LRGAQAWGKFTCALPTAAATAVNRSSPSSSEPLRLFGLFAANRSALISETGTGLRFAGTEVPPRTFASLLLCGEKTMLIAIRGAADRHPAARTTAQCKTCMPSREVPPPRALQNGSVDAEAEWKALQRYRGEIESQKTVRANRRKTPEVKMSTEDPVSQRT